MKHSKQENSTLAARASRALGWNFVNTVLSRLGTLGISIMLARLLGPHVFGAYAVALVALYAMQTFNELGMSMAIVRWEADPRDIIPTITTVSVIVSIVTYAGCFWIAPDFASAMGAPAATDVVRVLALAIVIDGFCNTPSGLLQRRFQQGKATIAAQVGNWVGVGLTVALALLHHNAMSLAIGQVAGSLVVAVFLIVFAPESLRFGFDPARARELLHFGLPLSGSNLISFGVMSVDQIIVGHMLGSTSLAFYVLAFNLSSWPYNMFATPVRNVAPAVFSRLQNDQPAMRGTFVSAARILTAVTFPICLFIGGSATALIGFVYGARWLPAAQPLIWLAVAGGARILLQLAYDYLVVLGWTRLLLIIQLVWLVALIPCLIGATRADGIYGAGLAEAAVALLVVLPCYLAALRKAGIGLTVLGRSLLLPLTAAAAAGVAAIGVGMLAPSNFSALAVSGVVTTALIVVIAYRMRSTFTLLRRMRTQREDAARAKAQRLALEQEIEVTHHPRGRDCPASSSVAQRPASADAMASAARLRAGGQPGGWADHLNVREPPPRPPDGDRRTGATSLDKGRVRTTSRSSTSRMSPGRKPGRANVDGGRRPQNGSVPGKATPQH